jgi:hypothetical protein
MMALMMEAARTSETSVGNYFTWQYIPEAKSELHTRCHENLTFQKKLCYLLQGAGQACGLDGERQGMKTEFWQGKHQLRRPRRR